MGKCMRKSKLTGEVQIMEGIQTRAKTLALQRLQYSDSTCHLQLRSRRLEKPKPSLLSSPRASVAAPGPLLKAKHTCKNGDVSGANLGISRNCFGLAGCANSASGGSAPVKALEIENEKDGSAEVSSRENVIELESRDRNTRETMHHSPMFNLECTGSQGSTTHPTNSNWTNRRTRNEEGRSIPTTDEMEEFFAGVEQFQQRTFRERYNFDPVNDCPLPGRYEWVRFNSNW